MKISDKGLNLLKKLEGHVKQNGKHIIYDDIDGRPVPPCKALPPGATIGYGHLIKPGDDFTNGITEQHATELLEQDLQIVYNAIKKHIHVPMQQNQFDALVILIYNIGEGNFKKSTIAKYINNPNFQSTVYKTPKSAWQAWNKHQGKISPGLVSRRNKEWDLYFFGIY